jgi:LPXTG-motif cell wall-anchored protein
MESKNIIIGGLALAVVGGVYYYKKRNKKIVLKNNENTNATTKTETTTTGLDDQIIINDKRKYSLAKDVAKSKCYFKEEISILMNNTDMLKTLKEQRINGYYKQIEQADKELTKLGYKEVNCLAVNI